MRERGSVYTRARLRNRHAGHPPVFERRKKNSRVSGTIDRRFLSIRGSPLLSIETRFKISPVPRAVCVAPRPREPGSHVIMAEVAEKKRFEVKKVRTTRVRRFSRGAARIFPAPCPKPKSRARSFARRDAPTTSLHADPHPVSRNSGTPSRCGRGPSARTRARFAATPCTSRPSSTRRTPRAPRRRGCPSRGATAGTCSTWTASPSGCARARTARCATRSGSSPRSKRSSCRSWAWSDASGKRTSDAARRRRRRRVVKGTCKKQTFSAFCVFVSRFAPTEPLDASPSSPRPRNTRSSRGFYVPITPHSRPPDHLVDERENRASRARRASRWKTKNKQKTKKNENTQGCAREPNVSPDALQLSHRDLRVGCVDSPPGGHIRRGRGGRKNKRIPLMGIEPTTLALGKQRSIH